jgi:hypothetical protein
MYIELFPLMAGQSIIDVTSVSSHCEKALDGRKKSALHSIPNRKRHPFHFRFRLPSVYFLSAFQRLQWIAGKVQLRNPAGKNARTKREKRECAMAPRIVMIAPRVRPRLNRLEAISDFSVCHYSSRTGKVWIKRRVVRVHLMPVTSRRMGLPNLHKRISNRTSVLFKYAAMHLNPFAHRITSVMTGQMIAVFANNSMTKCRPCSFRKGFGQQYEWHARRPGNRRYVRWVKMVGLGTRLCNFHVRCLDHSTSLDTFNGHRDTLSHTDTHGCKGKFPAGFLKLQRGRLH